MKLFQLTGLLMSLMGIGVSVAVADQPVSPKAQTVNSLTQQLTQAQTLSSSTVLQSTQMEARRGDAYYNSRNGRKYSRRYRRGSRYSRRRYNNRSRYRRRASRGSFRSMPGAIARKGRVPGGRFMSTSVGGL